MSVENLIKELDAVHEQVRGAQTLAEKVALMAERDKIMGSLVTARQAEAEYHQKQIEQIEEQARPKTVQMPYFNK